MVQELPWVLPWVRQWARPWVLQLAWVLPLAWVLQLAWVLGGLQLAWVLRGWVQLAWVLPRVRPQPLVPIHLPRLRVEALLEGLGTSGIFRARHCETTKRAGADQNIEKLEKL